MTNLLNAMTHDGQVTVTPTLSRAEAWCHWLDHQHPEETELREFLRIAASKLSPGGMAQLAAEVLVDLDERGER